MCPPLPKNTKPKHTGEVSGNRAKERALQQGRLKYARPSPQANDTSITDYRTAGDAGRELMERLGAPATRGSSPPRSAPPAKPKHRTEDARDDDERKEATETPLLAAPWQTRDTAVTDEGAEDAGKASGRGHGAGSAQGGAGVDNGRASAVVSRTARATSEPQAVAAAAALVGDSGEPQARGAAKNAGAASGPGEPQAVHERTARGAGEPQARGAAAAATATVMAMAAGPGEPRDVNEAGTVTLTPRAALVQAAAAHTYAYISICMYMYMCVYMYVCVYMYMYVCMYIYTCMYVCMYV